LRLIGEMEPGHLFSRPVLAGEMEPDADGQTIHLVTVDGSSEPVLLGHGRHVPSSFPSRSSRHPKPVPARAPEAAATSKKSRGRPGTPPAPPGPGPTAGPRRPAPRGRSGARKPDRPLPGPGWRSVPPLKW